jgi:hypothetical protein
MFPRDLRLLGYEDIVDPRAGGREMGVDESGTFILPDPKKRFYWESFWAPLWNGACLCLRAADEVYVFGYSMPLADERARVLLFDNIAKTAPINIYCRSASHRIAEEFRSRGFAHVRPFPSVDFEAWADANAGNLRQACE